MSRNDSFDNTAGQPAEEFNAEEGGGFNPSIMSTDSTQAIQAADKPEIESALYQGTTGRSELHLRLPHIPDNESRTIQAEEKPGAPLFCNKGTTSVGPQMTDNEGRALAPEGCSSPLSPEIPHFSAEDPTVGSSPWAIPENPLQDFANPIPVESAPETLFQSWSQPEAVPSTRIPHLGHLAVLAAILFVGILCMTMAIWVAVHFRFFGVATMEATDSEVHYLLGREAVLYLVTLAVSLFVFPLFWNKSFFAGVQWRGAVARRLYRTLALTALGCFVLAALDTTLLPGPENAPIDDLLRVPGAAWLLFVFGITLAPLFEEIIFRGFLLPAFCTAFDWIAEHTPGPSILSQDASGRPRWSPRAIIFASLLISVPFALCASAGHNLLRGLILLLWCGTAALAWMLISSRPSAAKERSPLVDEDGQPLWSMPAMVVAAIFTSLPFALLHGEQTGYSLGPFVQIFAVSLILCAVRLKTRSLAASTLVHACYNFLIFSIMMLGTGGFRHLDKM